MPIIRKNKVIYIHVMGFIWKISGFHDLRTLNDRTASELGKLIESCENDKIVYLDFWHITALANHADETLLKSINKKNITISLLNLGITIGPFESCAKDMNLSHVIKGTSLIFHEGKQSNPFDPEALLVDKTKEFIEESYRPFSGGPQRLPSTPYLSNGICDASSIIGHPEKYLITIAALSQCVEKMIQEHKLGGRMRLRIFSGSLRGTTLAVGVGIMLDMEVVPVDHIGPYHKVLEKYDFGNNRDKNIDHLIYVGDFVLGGTEIKISQNFVTSNGGRLEHAVLLASLYSEKEMENIVKLRYLTRFNELNIDVGIRI